MDTLWESVCSTRTKTLELLFPLVLLTLDTRSPSFLKTTTTRMMMHAIHELISSQTFASEIINCAYSKERLIAAVSCLGIRSWINSQPLFVSSYLLKDGNQLWHDFCPFLLQLEHRFRSPDKQFGVSKLHIWGETSFIYDCLHSVFLVTVVSGPSFCRDHFVPRNMKAVK